MTNNKGANSDNSNNNDLIEMKKNRKWRFTLTIGIAAGVIWGIYFLLGYYLQFSDIGPSILAKPILNPEYLTKWQGQLVGIIFFLLFAIIASFIYTLLLIRFKGPLAGIVYGALLWGFTFFILNPLFNLTKSVKELGWYTNSVMISLFVMMGLFIGYSIAAELNSEDKS